MANRYILGVAGEVIEIDYTKSNSPADIAKQNFEANIKAVSSTPNNPTDNVSYFSNYINESITNEYTTLKPDIFGVFGVDQSSDVINSETSKHSFGFIKNTVTNTSDENGVEIKTIRSEESNVTFESYKQINSFLDEVDGDGVIPYTEEFEFYTGYRSPTNTDENPGATALAFIVSYLADVIVQAAIVEAISTANVNLQKQTLVLGEYAFDEVDIFTKYFFNVLNYPSAHDRHLKAINGNYLKSGGARLVSYFVGLNEWLSQDRLIDWNIAIPKIPGIGNIDILTAVIDITLSNFSNNASLKRMMLLIKKMKTQKYWVDQKLYSAKRKSYTDYIIDYFNYYSFKFFIERVNVGNAVLLDTDKTITAEYHSLNYNKANFEAERPYSPATINHDGKEETAGAARANMQVLGSTGATQAQQGAQALAAQIVDRNNLYPLKKAYKFNVKKGLGITAIPSAFLMNISALPYASINLFSEGHFKVKEHPYAQTESNVLPIDLVNKIEKQLETEYVPFYFHDVRTNEIISFHAFIENISDSYSPEYSSTGGFGRLDDVKTYSKTSRSISLSFIAAAMNPDEHDNMWAYINKLVSLVYPQWSKGEELILKKEEKEIRMVQPFSQVITNSPMIRLRVGDVIKNNYSRFNLARIFGFKQINNTLVKKSDTSTNVDISDILQINDEQNLLEENLKEYFNTTSQKVISSFDNLLLKVNNKISLNITSDDVSIESFVFKDKKVYYVKLVINKKSYMMVNVTNIGIENNIFVEVRQTEFKNVLYDIAATIVAAKEKEDLAKKIGLTENSLTKKAEELIAVPLIFNRKNDNDLDFGRQMLDFVVTGNVSDNLNIKTNEFYKELLSYGTFNTEIDDMFFSDSEAFGDQTSVVPLNQREIETIMKPFDSEGQINNPITQAYESRMSKGLAGYITNLDLNYNDMLWDVREGSKAPMMVKVTMQFAPIHDIPMGLDHNGMNRAINYNVGDVNNALHGSSLQKYVALPNQGQ